MSDEICDRRLSWRLECTYNKAPVGINHCRDTELNEFLVDSTGLYLKSNWKSCHRQTPTGCCFHFLLFLTGCLSALLNLSVVLCECEREKARRIVWSTISRRSSRRDAHRQWHPYSITNQRGDKGLLHYWLRSCSSNKAIHPGDSMTGRYELDGCKRLSNSDIGNWNVGRVQTNRNLSQIFSIILL